MHHILYNLRIVGLIETMDSKTRNRMFLGIATLVVLITPIAAYAASFLDIRSAIVHTTSDKVDRANMATKETIPTDGNSGAFGYGIATGDSIIVTTTHKGVLDSAAQNGNPNNPIFHNHYVHLGNDAQHCGSSPVVTAITFAKTGDVTVANSGIILKNLPKTSDGLSQNNNVGPVVSFTLRVVHDGNNSFVCVDNIQQFARIVQ